MSTSSQNDFCRPKLCCLSCTQLTNTPKNTASGGIFGLAKPLRRIRKFLTDVRSGTPIYVCCFKHGRNRCSPRPRCCTCIATKETKHILALFGGTPGAISPPKKKNYASAHCGPTLMFQVSCKSVQVWCSHNQKPFHNPNVNAI